MPPQQRPCALRPGCCARHPRACPSTGSSGSSGGAGSSVAAPPAGDAPVLLTFEDRGLPLFLRRNDSTVLPGWVRGAINLAGGTGYRGWFTKPRALHSWLEAHLAALGGRRVVFVDGSDVLWGGCSNFEQRLESVAAEAACSFPRTPDSAARPHG